MLRWFSSAVRVVVNLWADDAFSCRYCPRRHFALHLHSNRDYSGSGAEQSPVDTSGLTLGGWASLLHLLPHTHLSLQTLCFYTRTTYKGTLQWALHCFFFSFIIPLFNCNIMFNCNILCNCNGASCVCARLQMQDYSTEVFFVFLSSSWQTSND